MRYVLLCIGLLCCATVCVEAQTAPIDKIIQQGIELYDKGDYSSALEQYSKALQLDSNNVEATYEMISTYFALEKYEKCIEYAQKLIARNVYLEHAYMFIGSAQDMLGKPLEAIDTYKRTLRTYPDSYLLHYNLAYTCIKIKDYKTAEASLIKAITLNPKHATSHFLLANLMNTMHQRVKAVLGMYHFLFLEPNTPRSKEGYKFLMQLLSKGAVKENDKTINITVDPNNDEFMTVDLMLSMSQAAKSTDYFKGKSEHEIFYSNTKLTFSLLGMPDTAKKGFWQNYYGKLFSSLAEDSTRTETFCYLVSQTNNDPEAYAWVVNNKERIVSLFEWYEKYLKKE